MDILFFYLSKVIWLVISPDSLLLLLLLFGVLMLWQDKNRLAKQILSFTSAFLVVVALFPVDEWILYPLENRFIANPSLPKKIDGIIVLSGPENAELSAAWNQVELNDGAERLLAFQSLARLYPEVKLVFTGGSGSMANQSNKGADVAKKQLEQQGANIARVIFENESRNTYENVVFSKKLVKNQIGENWILITSAYHMPRSIGVFCKAQWSTIPYPVDHRTVPTQLFRLDFSLANHLVGLTIGCKEWIGLVVYYVTGKTSSIYPQGC